MNGNAKQKLRLHAGNMRRIVRNRDGERARIGRRYAFDALGLSTSGVLADSGSFTFLVDTKDRALGRQTFSEGNYELDLMSSALRVLGDRLGKDVVDGQTFVDVGANIGTTAIPALLEFNASHVIAIEPGPRNFKLLRCNSVLNSCESSMSFLNCAVGDQSGVALLEMSASNSGDNRVRVVDYDGQYGEMKRPTVPVHTRTLADIVNSTASQKAAVGLIWVDTQGFEGHVLSTYGRMDQQSIPCVIEYWPYGLGRSGGTQMLHTVISRYFSEVYDIRAGNWLPASDVGCLHERYPARLYTDLLLVP